MGYAPLCIGFALPFLVLFLKSILLAFGAGPASLMRRGKGGLGLSRECGADRPAPRLAGRDRCRAGNRAGPGERGGTHRAHRPAARPHAEGGAAELPNWLVILHDFNPGNPAITWLERNQVIVYAWFAGFLFLFVSWLAMRKPKMVPGPFQNGVEWMVESMYEVCEAFWARKSASTSR